MAVAEILPVTAGEISTEADNREADRVPTGVIAIRPGKIPR